MATWGDLGAQLVVSGGGVAVVLAVINGVSSRRVTRAAAANAEADVDEKEASASQKLVDTAMGMLKPLQEQLNDLRADFAQQRAELLRQRANSDRLREELAHERGAREQLDLMAQITAHLMADHVRWDLLVLDTLAAHGIAVDHPPPPLRPERGDGS